MSTAHNPVRKFPTGARRSPLHVIHAATPHRVLKTPPAEFAIVPQKLDMWGNSQYGDCVSAEEAFAKACYSPEIFIPAQTVIDWASKNGYLNGADLSSVMQSMQQNGFQVGQQTYDDGPPSSVDWSKEDVLQSAISQGPVKIAIAASCLPSGAGNQQGWWITGSQNDFNTDHCVALCGYGTADYLYKQLNVPLPSGLSASTTGYLLYTWSTIGFVDHAWIMGTCAEAWLRNPTTIGNPPLPNPGPNPNPNPGPNPPGNDSLNVLTPVPNGTFNFVDANNNPVASITTSGIPTGSYQLVLPTPPQPTLQQQIDLIIAGANSDVDSYLKAPNAATIQQQIDARMLKMKNDIDALVKANKA